MAKVKGAAIVESVRILRRHKEEARKHLPQPLHHYLSERVLAASWYPSEDQIPLVRAVARVLGEPSTLLREGGALLGTAARRGRLQAPRAGARPETLCRRALVLWSSQHDTGQMEMVVADEGRVRVVLRGFANSSREACLVSSGYLAATFEISGYKGVRVLKQRCCLDGAPECAWDVTFASS
jgi:hypothetical protein